MHADFLSYAIQLASENVEAGAGGPYGAVIVKNNRIVAASANQVSRQTDPTAHAEIIAIRLACRELNDYKLKECTLYTSCEPCPMCLGAIYWARLAKVYFACSRHDAAGSGFDDSFIYDQIQIDPAKRQIQMLQIDLASATEPFKKWNRKTDKVLY